MDDDGELINSRADAFDALSWAVRMLQRRDEMNAAVHCQHVRYSQVTIRLEAALTWLAHNP